MVDAVKIDLPELDCGLCGYRTCEELRERLTISPEMIRRCIHLSDNRIKSDTSSATGVSPAPNSCTGKMPVALKSAPPSHTDKKAAAPLPVLRNKPLGVPWRDSLDREFDFYLEHFPEEPGPREIIIPHNPMITREMEIKRGDLLIGRPLGMSCGCPITHCGVATDVDLRTGVIVWCVTGPLGPREKGFKDLGYYIAEGYEGLVHETRVELKVGMRYYFQPRMCMLQWRHSGLINYLNRLKEGYQIRLEGLWIG
jgi:uncharacterized Fe-S cluster-containing protein